MKQYLILFFVTFVLIAAGTYIYYTFGYKDNFWITGAAYLLVILGWLCPLFLLIGLHMKVSKAGRGAGSKIATGLYFVVYPVWLVALVAGFLKLDELKDERISRILSTTEVMFTSAKVVRVEERRIKSTSHLYAVIEYNAAGTKVQQAIKDDERLHKAGDELRIKYSKDYPDMFALTEQ